MAQGPCRHARSHGRAWRTCRMGRTTVYVLNLHVLVSTATCNLKQFIHHLSRQTRDRYVCQTRNPQTRPAHVTWTSTVSLAPLSALQGTISTLRTPRYNIRHPWTMMHARLLCAGGCSRMVMCRAHCGAGSTSCQLCAQMFGQHETITQDYVDPRVRRARIERQQIPWSSCGASKPAVCACTMCDIITNRGGVGTGASMTQVFSKARCCYHPAPTSATRPLHARAHATNQGWDRTVMAWCITHSPPSPTPPNVTATTPMHMPSQRCFALQLSLGCFAFTDLAAPPTLCRSLRAAYALQVAHNKETEGGGAPGDAHADDGLEVSHVATEAIARNAAAKHLRDERRLQLAEPRAGRIEVATASAFNLARHRTSLHRNAITPQTICAHSAVVVEVSYAALASAAVVNLALLIVHIVGITPAPSKAVAWVWAPYQAADTEGLAIFADVAHALEGAPIAQHLRDRFGQRETVLRRALDHTWVTAEDASEAYKRHDCLRIYETEEHPSLRLLHHR